MSFAKIDELFRANLADARRAALPERAGPIVEIDGVFGPPAADRAKLRKAHRAAIELTKRQANREFGPDAWRDYRDEQSRLGAPEFRDGEMVRRTRSGSLRVDRLDR